ncbi:acyl carrier protein [Candidatus Bathyarchaeota archaeon]|nr:acyl carrier protein [Candidatus Bathyarchaeota archaeon]RLI26749.1 MAG: acyl carrier protein [Candidatus Bathyarchaeota archaeon]RLI29250.1 MAG: acyl carrier protein [Candidatus Bathyarchaeota archaeon]
MSESIEARAKRLIAEQFGVDPEELKPETHLVKDLKMESLDKIELIAAFEEEFDIEIPEEEAERNVTVGQVIEYVKAKLGVK